jgi:hypothetical protein
MDRTDTPRTSAASLTLNNWSGSRFSLLIMGFLVDWLIGFSAEFGHGARPVTGCRCASARTNTCRAALISAETVVFDAGSVCGACTGTATPVASAAGLSGDRSVVMVVLEGVVIAGYRWASADKDHDTGLDFKRQLIPAQGVRNVH